MLSEAQHGSLKGVFDVIAGSFSGVKLELRLFMAVELLARCVMNNAFWYTRPIHLAQEKNHEDSGRPHGASIEEV